MIVPRQRPTTIGHRTCAQHRGSRRSAIGSIVVQDDAGFLIAIVDPALNYHVTAIAMPFGPNRRRRFEVALGNKLDKIDLEACVAVGDEVWAFGSGSLPVREKLVRVVRNQGDQANVVDAAPFYAALRGAIGALNLEGVAGWTTSSGSVVAGTPVQTIQVRRSRESAPPMCERFSTVRPPTLLAIDRFDLGSIDGARLGFTDASARAGLERVFYVAAAEASPDAIDNGEVLGSQFGVIDGETVRAAPLVGLDGRPREGRRADVHRGPSVGDPGSRRSSTANALVRGRAQRVLGDPSICLAWQICLSRHCQQSILIANYSWQHGEAMRKVSV